MEATATYRDTIALMNDEINRERGRSRNLVRTLMAIAIRPDLLSRVDGVVVVTEEALGHVDESMELSLNVTDDRRGMRLDVRNVQPSGIVSPGLPSGALGLVGSPITMTHKDKNGRIKSVG